MSKSPIYIFFDNLIIEYKNSYGNNWETQLIKDLKNYFADFYKNSTINLITFVDEETIKNWALKNNLSQYINDISKPKIK